MARNPCKHPEHRQEEMIPSNALPSTPLWVWWWCKDCGAVQMRFTRNKDGVRLCGGSKNLENWRSPRMLCQGIDKRQLAEKLFLRAEMRVTLAVQAKNKLVQAITSLCNLTGAREHLDPEQCVEHIREHWAMVEQAYSLLAEACNIEASMGIEFEATNGYEALVALRKALGHQK